MAILEYWFARDGFNAAELPLSQPVPIGVVRCQFGLVTFLGKLPVFVCNGHGRLQFILRQAATLTVNGCEPGNARNGGTAQPNVHVLCHGLVERRSRAPGSTGFAFREEL